MTRGKYLDELTERLHSLSDRQVKEIVAEIYAHFEEGIDAGYTEEAIAEGLGAPGDVAREYLKLYEPGSSTERAPGDSPLRMFGEEPYCESWELPFTEYERLKADISCIEVSIVAADGNTLRAEFDGFRVKDAHGEAPRIAIVRDGKGITIDEVRPRAESGGWITRILSSVPRLRGKLTVFIPRKIGEMRTELKSGFISIEGACVDSFKSEIRSGKMTIEEMISGGDIYIETYSGQLLMDEVESEKVYIAVKSGSARIRGLESESIAFETSSGKLDACDVTVRGAVNVSVKSGMIQLSEVNAKTFDLECHSGSANVQMLAAEALRAEVTSGSTQFRLKNEADMELSVRSGSIAISMPEDQGFTYDVDTKSGSVKIAFDGKREEHSDQGHRHTRGVVGGGARKVKAEALSGTIQIKKCYEH